MHHIAAQHDAIHTTRRTTRPALRFDPSARLWLRLGRGVALFLVAGVVLIPMLWLTGIPLYRQVAAIFWSVGRAVCSYTDMSLTIGGYPMMVCARCFGATLGMVTVAFAAPNAALRHRIPYRRLHRATLIAALALPWLLDSGLERLHLHTTNIALILPTGFLGGAALALAPLLFWPRADADDDRV